jgi:hypothetical protein
MRGGRTYCFNTELGLCVFLVLVKPFVSDCLLAVSYLAT